MNISSSDLRRLRAIRPQLPLVLGKDGEWLADMLGFFIELNMEAGLRPKTSEKAYRNELLREHDRRFNLPSDSLTCRAKAIEKDLKLASSGRRIVDLRVVSAQSILNQNSGKCLRYRHIMEIIQ